MKLNRTALSEVELGQPIINEGTYFARLSVTTKENNAKTGMNLVVTAKLHDDTLTKRADSSEFQNRGIKLTRYISLVPTDNYNPDESIKQLALAVGHDGDDVDTADIEGRDCKVVIGYAPANDKFKRDSNPIDRFVKITEADDFNPPA